MKATHLALLKLLKIPPFLLLGIAAGLVAINLTLVWKARDIGHLGMSALFWLAVASLLWEKRHSLSIESGIFPSLLGALLIAWVLLNSASLPDGQDPIVHNRFLRISPFISALGLGLIASGFRGLKQYWRELTIVFFLGIPSVLASFLTDISPFTAKFATFLLWYSGFDVSLQSLNIILPTGRVRVYSACSGIESMTYLLGVAVICLVMFPPKWSHRILVPIVALILGFVVNGVRVALMAVLAGTNSESFDYWHIGEGSLLFGMIAIAIFGLFYAFLLRQDETVETEEQIGQ